MSKDALPCLVCGVQLERTNDDYEVQPNGGIILDSSGNYGSTKFDPFDGSELVMNLCDDCLVKAGEQGRILVTRRAIPVRTDTMVASGKVMTCQTGWHRMEAPFVPWKAGLPGFDSTEFVEYNEILPLFDNPAYKWNLTREGYEFNQSELDAHYAKLDEELPDAVLDI